MMKFIIPVPINEILFGNSVFADVINLKQIHTLLRVDSMSNDSKGSRVFIRRGEENLELYTCTQTHSGKKAM